MPRPLLALVGPTATGKTATAVALAQRWGGELVVSDSRQLIRRLRVGTAAPTEEELSGVRCHLLDLREPSETLSVASWVEAARAVLDDLERRGVPALVVGGTGLYLRALRRGWDFGGRQGSPARQRESPADRGAAGDAAALPALVAELRAVAPEALRRVDAANPRRVLRALELAREGRDPAQRSALARIPAVVVLDARADVHRAAVDARIDRMFGEGLILEEVRVELSRGTPAEALRRCGIGYAEALDLIAGTATVGEAAARVRQRTLRYAKAQRTWFRAEPAVLRLTREHESPAELAQMILEALAAPPRAAACVGRTALVAAQARRATASPRKVTRNS